MSIFYCVYVKGIDTFMEKRQSFYGPYDISNGEHNNKDASKGGINANRCPMCTHSLDVPAIN